MFQFEKMEKDGELRKEINLLILALLKAIIGFIIGWDIGMTGIAAARVRYGYFRIYILLRREG